MDRSWSPTEIFTSRIFVISSYFLESPSDSFACLCQAHGWNLPACSLITYLPDFRDPSHRCLSHALVPDSTGELIQIGKMRLHETKFMRFNREISGQIFHTRLMGISKDSMPVTMSRSLPLKLYRYAIPGPVRLAHWILAFSSASQCAH